MSQRIITFLDTETTGVNEPGERIVEFCGVRYDLDTGAKLNTALWRIKPDVPIKAKAQKVHGITMNDLANCPEWHVIAPLIKGVIEPSYAAVAHNGFDFDFDFIEREMMRVGLSIRWPIRFDTMRDARWATGNGKNPKLGELATCLDVPYDPDQAHGAEYDCICMAQCFFEARRLGWFNLP